jgi:hypothetical protein
MLYLQMALIDQLAPVEHAQAPNQADLQEFIIQVFSGGCRLDISRDDSVFSFCKLFCKKLSFIELYFPNDVFDILELLKGSGVGRP